MTRANALAVFGRAEPASERWLLKAGPLTAIVEEGNLRTIFVVPEEIIRTLADRVGHRTERAPPERGALRVSARHYNWQMDQAL